MSLADQTAYLDATALADLVRRKEVTPTELVDAAIARIEQANPAVNAVVTPMYDSARKAAARPHIGGPFAGVPFLLKDLLATYGGVRMTEGSRMLGGYVPQRDSELVRRYREAGLIVVARRTRRVRHRPDDRTHRVRQNPKSLGSYPIAGWFERRLGGSGRGGHGPDGTRQ